MTGLDFQFVGLLRVTLSFFLLGIIGMDLLDKVDMFLNCKQMLQD